MKSQLELKHTVSEELEWEPSLDAAHIGVAVEDGVVTLTGTVPSYAEKLTAERAAKRVMGVKAVANDLQVKTALPVQRSDTDIARAALDALEWNIAVPHERLRVRVADGWLTLEGEVALPFHRAAAENAVRHLIGVKGVTNVIRIAPAVKPSDVKSRIEAAFRRSAEIDARRIQVETEGRKVILRGNVRTWAEREEAERAAWAAPGVSEVEDDLLVGF